MPHRRSDYNTDRSAPTTSTTYRNGSQGPGGVDPQRPPHLPPSRPKQRSPEPPWPHQDRAKHSRHARGGRNSRYRSGSKLVSPHENRRRPHPEAEEGICVGHRGQQEASAHEDRQQIQRQSSGEGNSEVAQELQMVQKTICTLESSAVSSKVSCGGTRRRVSSLPPTRSPTTT